MGRSTIAVAVTAGLILLLSTIQLLDGYNAIDVNISHLLASSYDGKHSAQSASHAAVSKDGSDILVGVGKADITGPVVEINLMGYADPAQLGTGVRQRLYSRAFIVASATEPKDRWVYLVLDTQSGDTAVRHGILETLGTMGDDYALYGNQNVAVTGTHSHSGPGAWLNYLLPQITSKGFNGQSYQAIVDGAIESIKRAHESLQPGALSVGTVRVEDANTNRSPYAYLANPSGEREEYEDNVDKDMTVLRFNHTSNGMTTDIGVLTWFPVHGTSMYGNNTLITGDNKGVAAYLFEQSLKQYDNPDFVAGFSQANVGDTSPNVLGAYCEYGDYEGEMCDFKTSLCGDKNEPCHGRGPYYGRDDAGTSSTFEIGRRQYQAARTLLDNVTAFETINANVVKASHHFVDMSNFVFPLANGTLVRTCPAAMGYSFAAGTTDGPGAFDFKQAQPGDPHANPLWSLIGNRVATPNDTQVACHEPKPILLDVGESDNPYAWAPNIVDVQILRAGPFFVIVSPGEATTMSGRRWKAAVREAASSLFASDLQASNSTDPIVVLGGPANTYGHYIATQEEYGIQRYEGASTLYGPHTLNAYINLTLSFLPDLAASSPSYPLTIIGPEPPINTNRSLSFITGVIMDGKPLFKSFGDVTEDVLPSYRAGDTIQAKFVGANPRNNLRLGGTFASVELYDAESGTWEAVRSDEDWSLVYEWERTSTVIGTSEVTVSWETKWETGEWRDGSADNTAAAPALSYGGEESDEEQDPHGDLALRGRQAIRPSRLAGKYRLKYYGDAKSLGGSITAFEGTSGEFVIE